MDNTGAKSISTRDYARQRWKFYLTSALYTTVKISSTSNALSGERTDSGQHLTQVNALPRSRRSLLDGTSFQLTINNSKRAHFKEHSLLILIRVLFIFVAAQDQSYYLSWFHRWWRQPEHWSQYSVTGPVARPMPRTLSGGSYQSSAGRGFAGTFSAKSLCQS